MPAFSICSYRWSRCSRSWSSPGAGAAAAPKDEPRVGVLLGIVLLLGYNVWAFLVFVKGLTPGKKLLGIRVIKEDGTSPGFFTMLIRELMGKPISALVLFLGFLWILFDRDKQGWHDKLMSTYVVE
ncbi:MAG: hypothetical protein KatS3mg077_1501 [Candidatus Binatia bacterium]|nr:MAG: hypothetical protein KatS3mg077_1501 [Candidatus Binatia bacterium]